MKMRIKARRNNISTVGAMELEVSDLLPLAATEPLHVEIALFEEESDEVVAVIELDAEGTSLLIGHLRVALESLKADGTP